METGIVKKAVLMIMICTLIGVVFGLRYYERQGAAGEEYAVDEAAYEETASENKDVYLDIGIKFSGDWQQKIALYPDGETLYAFLPAGTDRAGFRWSFDESRYEVMYDGLKISDNEAVAVRDGGVPVSVRELPGNVEAAYQFYVMQSENISAIFINTQSGGMDWVHAKKGNREPGELASLDENGTLVYAGGLERITGRGNSS